MGLVPPITVLHPFMPPSGQKKGWPASSFFGFMKKLFGYFFLVFRGVLAAVFFDVFLAVPQALFFDLQAIAIPP